MSMTNAEWNQFLSAAANALDDSPIELHIRGVLKAGPDFYARCSCGFFTTSCLTEEEAFSRPCDVEEALIASRERERRVLLMMGAGRA